METTFGEYMITDDKALLNREVIYGFLQRSYWANQRPIERTDKAISNSHCYGVYDKEKRQVGFARVVTDGATVFYLCDVFIDESHRGREVGQALVGAIFNSEEYRGLGGILGTADAHGLYEKFGFVREPERFMRRPPID
jgi:ribosomal protein S18 acetylase RimI-like enzyme